MSAFFSGSEVALFSLSRLDLSKLRSSRDPAAEPIHRMLKEPRSLIISILCGNESVNIASSANMAAFLLLFFSEEQTRWINLVIMVPVLLLVGEVTPKTVAITMPVLFASRVTAWIMPTWILIVTPVRKVVRVVADSVTTFIVGKPVAQENILHTDEFRTLVEEGEAAGAIDPREGILIGNMLEASETEVIQIMTPCTRMNYLDADKPLVQILEDFRRFKHPHMPVIRKHRNNILGFLETEDIRKLLALKPDFSRLRIDDLLRPAHFVPPNKKVDEMFDYFRHHDTWAAIVLGEYGDVFGIVTIADVLGFVFSGISQKIDALGQHVKKDEQDLHRVRGDMSIILFNDMTRIEVDVPEDTMITTVGGYVFHLLGRLPQVGDEVEEDGVRFVVTEMDNLMIKSVEVCRVKPRNTAAGTPSGELPDATPNPTETVSDAGNETVAASSDH
ncbi:MAG: HlyC/CorC family transporter [Magnetococcales bacterium]|nr:HlyC/CorC family transporter [Magnetococcales bacterium]